MSSVRSARGLFARALVVSIGAVLVLTVALVDVASAHGAVVDPASRNYGCLDRWRDNHMNPAMQTEDPMCWDAYQANPNAMWNWNGVYRDNVGGNHQGQVPNGTLCSAGNTESGRYDFLDTPGPWTATPVSSNFQVRLFDQASHGADFIRVYVTRQGFDPLTQRPGWGDLEQVGEIGYTPASQWQQEVDGVAINIPANAPGRSGRHIVYTVWQASHQDQVYYMCSDVTFGGGNQPPPPPPPPGPQPPPPPPPPPGPQPPPPPPPAQGDCSATYTETSSWGSGFQGEVQVTAGSAGISGWTVTMAFSGGQIQQGWNANLDINGSSVTATNAAYNGTLSSGQSTTFGMLGSGSGGSPTLSCSAS